MKFNKAYIFLIITAFLLTNCEDLKELNENPNQPEEVSPGVLLTSSIRSTANSMVTESFLLGNNIAQLTAKTLRTEVDVYSWNAFPTVWESLYDAAANVVEVERIALEEGNDNMVAVSKILRSYIFSVLTLAYGDVPYSEAFSGVSENNWFPVYDTQQAIITGENGLLAELEEAAGMLNPNGASIEGDIIFEGNTAKWQRFANSLRLRILMHLSTQQDVSAEFASIVNSSEIMSSIDDNAIMVYTGVFPNEYPLLPLKQGDFDAVVMSESAVSVMENLNDPRLGEYARPTNIDEAYNNPEVDAEFDGAVNGLETGGCDKTGSRLGLSYYNYPGHPTSDSKANGILMSYAEVEFLLAEAAQRGWISSDAETHYQNGIKASMDYYNVDFAAFGYTDFNDFYTNSNAAYDEQLISIYCQKWLALFFHGLDPYFELRRWMFENDFQWSEIPFVSPPCQNINDDMLPLRFLYPGEEQSLNAENYADAVQRLGENSQNAAIWLMQ